MFKYPSITALLLCLVAGVMGCSKVDQEVPTEKELHSHTSHFGMGLTYTADVTEEKRLLVENDLEFLSKLSLDENMSEKLKKKMKLQDVSPGSLIDWLGARVKYFVS